MLGADDILYEDNHIIAVKKKAGDISQGDITGDKPLGDYVKDYIKVKYNKPGEVFLGVIHRLDRPTSGLIIFARTSKALTRMTKAFKNRSIDKVYWALVRDANLPTQGACDNYLWKDEKKNKSFVVEANKKGAKQAKLSFEVLKQVDKYQLVQCHLETGRHHQIRVQLSHLKAPIIGDNKYGYTRANRDKSIHLHCRSMSFEHPTTNEQITIVSPLPKDVLWDKFSDVR